MSPEIQYGCDGMKHALKPNVSESEICTGSLGIYNVQMGDDPVYTEH